MLTGRLKQPKGTTLCKVRDRIKNLDVVAQKEHAKGIRNSEGLAGYLLQKNEVLVYGVRCLSDYELMKALRNSHIAHTYEYRAEC